MSEHVGADSFNTVAAPPGGTAGRKVMSDFDPEPTWYESAADLLSEPDPGPTPFLVEGLIVDAAVAAIQGPPKVGKTWLVLDLAVAVVTGRETLSFSVPDPGPVLVVLEESGRAALHRRLGQLARGNAIRPEALRDLHVAANKGVRLDEPEWAERIVDAANMIGARAIFLDPLARVKGATVDENVQREIGPVLDALRDLRERTGAAVVFVHHTPHTGGHLRGSSDIEATWESKLSVSRDENGVCSVVAEHREAESGPKLRYRLSFDGLTESVRLTLTEEPDAEAKRQAELEEHVQAVDRSTPGLTANGVLDALREGGIKFERQKALAAVRAVRSAETTETLSPALPESSTWFGTPANHPEPPPSRLPGGGSAAGASLKRARREPPGPGGSEPLPLPGEFPFVEFLLARHEHGHVTDTERDERLRLHNRIGEQRAS